MPPVGSLPLAYMGTIDELFQEMLSLLLRCDLSTGTSLCCSYSINHVWPHLFLSREDDDDVRDIGKQDFSSVLLHLLLSNANLKKKILFRAQVRNFESRAVLAREADCGKGRRKYWFVSFFALKNHFGLTHKLGFDCGYLH